MTALTREQRDALGALAVRAIADLEAHQIARLEMTQPMSSMGQKICREYYLACPPAVTLSLLKALDDTEAALAALRTPDIVGIDDECYYREDDFDGLVDYPGETKQVWANHYLGRWWAAMVVLTRDDEGDADTMEIQLFPTEEEALAATAVPS